MPDWQQGFRSQGEILKHATAHAFADAMAMQTLDEMHQQMGGIHLRSIYDMDMDDLEVAIGDFLRCYLDPKGLRADESLEAIEGDSGVTGAFFIGLLTGWRYNQLNDHTFPDKKEEQKAS